MSDGAVCPLCVWLCLVCSIKSYCLFSANSSLRSAPGDNTLQRLGSEFSGDSYGLGRLSSDRACEHTTSSSLSAVLSFGKNTPVFSCSSSLLPFPLAAPRPPVQRLPGVRWARAFLTSRVRVPISLRAPSRFASIWASNRILPYSFWPWQPQPASPP